LMYPSLLSGISWTRGFMSCIPKVCFFRPHMGTIFWPWGPIFLIEMMILIVSMNMTC
jgi:hypothetical protein